MLKIDTTAGEGRVVAQGTSEDIAIEIASAINQIYFSLRRGDPEEAEIFKGAIKCTVSNPESPVFNKETKPVTEIRYSVPIKEGKDHEND